MGSLPAHSAALLSGERRRLTTACVCSRGLAPPRAAPRLHSAWPRLLACARLGHAPLPVPQARRLGGLAQPSLLALSGHLGGSSARSKRARHSGAHGRLRATLPASRLASPRGRSLWSSPRPLARGLRVRRLQPRTKSPRTVASADASNRRSSAGGTRAAWRVGGCCVGAGRPGAGASHVHARRSAACWRGAARRAARASSERRSGVPCGSVGLGNVLHALRSPGSSAWGMCDSYGPTALDSRDCRHVDPCHMTAGRVVHCRMTPPGVVRHHCRHDTSRCRTTPPSYDTSGPSYDATVAGVVRRTTQSCDATYLSCLISPSLPARMRISVRARG